MTIHQATNNCRYRNQEIQNDDVSKPVYQYHKSIVQNMEAFILADKSWIQKAEAVEVSIFSKLLIKYKRLFILFNV